jgi:SAM-dependent methyltransferase
VTSPNDRREHRDWLASFATLPESGLAVDLGCGRGEDLRALAARHPAPGMRFLGVDSSAESNEAAASATADPRVSFRRASVESELPFETGSVDLVFSHNLVECLPDPRAFAREVARILRPEGQAIIAHWDWETQVWDSADKALVRRLVTAYAEWQQAWMAHADGWMGRRLWGVFNTTGAFDGAVHARVLTNTAFEPPWFGHENARALGGLTRRGLAAADDHERFMAEQAALAAQGRYFYGISGFAFVGRRLARQRGS